MKVRASHACIHFAVMWTIIEYIFTQNPILLFRNEGELLLGFGLRLCVLGALWYIFRLEF